MKQNDPDTLIVILVAAVLGPPLLAKFLTPVRDALISWHILVTDAAVLPITDGDGFDLPRVLLLAAMVGLIGLLLFSAFRGRAARKAEADS